MSEQVIACANCKSDYSLKDCTFAREVADDVKEYYIECPDCGRITHMYYETLEIVLARQKLQEKLETYTKSAKGNKMKRWEQYTTMREAFQRQFKDTQQRWLRKRPVKA